MHGEPVASCVGFRLQPPTPHKIHRVLRMQNQSNKSQSIIESVDALQNYIGGSVTHVIHYKMKTPRGIDVNVHLGNHHHFAQQHEVILPRDTKFMKIHEADINGVKHHYLQEM